MHTYQPQQYGQVSQLSGSPDSNPLIVDLGYEIYQGVSQDLSQVNFWKGIRYAADTSGANRWQPPQVPTVNRGSTISAQSYPSQCPQSTDYDGKAINYPGIGSEDCLFLDVYAPQNASGLPVLVWIHGGGYVNGNGQTDMTDIITANNQSFVAVSIQYRLGAFGFLSSQDVYQYGAVNAGILDQVLALQWVQQYVALFGGDPTKVTLSGGSAGAGSVMLLGTAYEGSLGNSLFTNMITASPYGVPQYDFNSSYPTYVYHAFAKAAGCPVNANNTLYCLISSDSGVLQHASAIVSTSMVSGTWGFSPVTDGVLITDIPATYLQTGRLNGRTMLTGNNALEASDFVPTNITTPDDLTAFIQLYFPSLTKSDIQAVLNQYPGPNQVDNPNAPHYATNGVSSPTFVTQSSVATGNQQRAIALYSEANFDCPSYWLAQAYDPSSDSTNNVTGGWKYQYSVIPAVHSQDSTGYFGTSNGSLVHSADFVLAFSNIWGRFVTTSNPSIPSLLANGNSTGNNTFNPASSWQTFSSANQWAMMDLNETSTSLLTVPSSSGPLEYPSGEISNAITLANGYSWEGGRGARCEFWRSMAQKIAQDPTTTGGLAQENTSAEKLGIGLGVGLGVPLFLAVLVISFWFWRRRNHSPLLPTRRRMLKMGWWKPKPKPESESEPELKSDSELESKPESKPRLQIGEWQSESVTTVDQ